MKIKPLADRILIKPLEEDQLLGKDKTTSSGIVLPDTAEKEKPAQGKVLAVGPGRITNDGKRQALEVKKGDIVLFSKYGPTEIKIKDEEYLIAKEEDVLAVIEVGKK